MIDVTRTGGAVAVIDRRGLGPAAALDRRVRMCHMCHR